jgi:hypothetical protein
MFSHSKSNQGDFERHTLNISHTLLQNLLENFGVFKLLANLGDDGICQFFLLSGLDLTFVPHPRIQNCLRFRRKGSLLLQLKGL